MVLFLILLSSPTLSDTHQSRPADTLKDIYPSLSTMGRLPRTSKYGTANPPRQVSARACRVAPETMRPSVSSDHSTSLRWKSSATYLPSGYDSDSDSDPLAPYFEVPGAQKFAPLLHVLKIGHRPRSKRRRVFQTTQNVSVYTHIYLQYISFLL